MEPVFFILKIFENFENTFHFFKINFFCKNYFFLYIVLLFSSLFLVWTANIYSKDRRLFVYIFFYIYSGKIERGFTLFPLYFQGEIQMNFPLFYLYIYIVIPHKTSYPLVFSCTHLEIIVLPCPHLKSGIPTFQKNLKKKLGCW